MKQLLIAAATTIIGATAIASNSTLNYVGTTAVKGVPETTPCKVSVELNSAGNEIVQITYEGAFVQKYDNGPAAKAARALEASAYYTTGYEGDAIDRALVSHPQVSLGEIKIRTKGLTAFSKGPVTAWSNPNDAIHALMLLQDDNGNLIQARFAPKNGAKFGNCRNLRLVL